MNRIDRLSAMLIMLQSSSIVKPKQIIDRFSIGIRTVYRDIRALEEAGIPIVGDSRIGYSLIEGFKLPPLMFNQDEAIAFLAAQRLVAKFSDKGIRDSYHSGVEKIRAVMRIAEKDSISIIDDKIGSLDFSLSTLDNQQSWLQILMNSITQRKKIELDYLALGSNEYTTRIVDTVGVFFSMANWYMIGFCDRRKDYRTFRLSRIQKVAQTTIDADIEHPALQSFLKTLGEQQELKEVVIEVAHSDLQLIDSQKYYQGLVAENNVGDVVQLHFMVFSIERFARWYLSYLDIAHILSPLTLKTAVEIILKNSKLSNE